MEVEFLESIEPVIEIVNLTIACVIFLVCLKVKKIVTGKLASAWNYFIYSAAIFFLHEVVGILEELNIWSFTALYDFTEFMYITFLAISAYQTYKIYKEVSKIKTK
jgi:hypothetical protein